jgi:hypothetical protein
VFPTGHAPNDCVPTAAQAANLTQAQVIITDANGQQVSIPVNSAGNFMRSAAATPALAFPIHAKVVYMSKERAMVSAQTSGDCNSCHTQAGAQGAPGRIALPN